MTTSSLSSAQTAVHTLSRPLSPYLGSRSFSQNLVAALRSRRATSDITHILSLPSTPEHEAMDILQVTLSHFETDSNGLPAIWIWEVLGVAVEIYR